MRFGLPFIDQNISDSQFFVRELKTKSEKHLRAYSSLFISHLCEPGDPTATTFEDGVPKEGLNVSQVLTRIGIISLIKRKVYEYESKHGLVSMKLLKKPPPPTQATSILAKPVENGNDSSEQKPKDTVTSVNENSEDTSTEVKTEEVKEEPMEVDNPDQDKKEEPVEEVDKIKEVVKEDVEIKSQDIQKEEEKGSATDISENKVNDENKKSEEENKEIAVETNGTKEEEIDEVDAVVKEFEFSIKDGGFTELHTLWYFEEKELKPKHEHEIWNKRHDYWMLAGIVKHGYERWNDLAIDEDFAILNEPFKNSLNLREKFMERRLRLLEQALVFEEQLRRFSHLSSVPKLVQKEEEKKVDGEEEEKKENGDDKQEIESKQNGDEKKENGNIENGEDKENECDDLIINPSLQKASNYLEDLLIDMKSDCARIPQTVQRIPSIANRLQIGPRPNSVSLPMANRM